MPDDPKDTPKDEPKKDDPKDTPKDEPKKDSKPEPDGWNTPDNGDSEALFTSRESAEKFAGSPDKVEPRGVAFAVKAKTPKNE